MSLSFVFTPLWDCRAPLFHEGLWFLLTFLTGLAEGTPPPKAASFSRGLHLPPAAACSQQPWGAEGHSPGTPGHRFECWHTDVLRCRAGETSPCPGTSPPLQFKRLKCQPPDELPPGAQTLLGSVSISYLRIAFPRAPVGSSAVSSHPAQDGPLWWQLLPIDLEIFVDTLLHLMPPPSPVPACGAPRIPLRTKDPLFIFLPKPHPSGMSSLLMLWLPHTLSLFGSFFACYKNKRVKSILMTDVFFGGTTLPLRFTQLY